MVVQAAVGAGVRIVVAEPGVYARRGGINRAGQLEDANGVAACDFRGNVRLGTVL